MKSGRSAAALIGILAMVICSTGPAVRAIAAPGVITTFAGGGIGDGGPASAAALRGTEGVFLVPSGAVYIADTDNNRIRMVDSLGVITTVAGSGGAGYSGDGGSAARAELNAPRGVYVDPAGAIYIADTDNNRIRMVDSLGVITTVVGTGTSGFSGDGGAATDAMLSSPGAVFVDPTGWLYVADTGNDRIRVIDGLGVVTTMAGGGTGIGEGGPATAAKLSAPSGVFVDSLGVLYVSDTDNHRIRKIDPSRTIITTAGTGTAGLAGDGGPATAASLEAPRGLFATGDGSLYFSDSGNHRVRKVDPLGVITTVAGKSGRGFAGDGGLATEAALDTPSGVSVGTAGEILIADSGNNRIRTVSGTGTITSTVGAGPVGSYTDAYFGDGGHAAAAGLDSPVGIFVGGSGDVLICDTDNERVRRIDGTTGIISTVAGNGTGGYGGDGILATETSIDGPRSAFRDGLGNLYIADTANHRVRRVDASGEITTEVGTGIDGYMGDGRQAEAARLNWPSAVFVDRWGNLYVSDYNNNRIRKVDAKSGVIATVAGSGTIGPLGGTFAGDGGAATVARLNQPSGIFVDRFGDLYIADTLNNRVRKVDAQSGMISTVAGNGIIGYSGDGGAATSASLSVPQGVFVDDGGYLFIADAGNNRVRRVDPFGVITTVAGTGTAGLSGDGGGVTLGMLNNPTGVFVDGSGGLYVVDTGNSRIRHVEAGASPTLLAAGAFSYPDETIMPDVVASWPVDGARNIDPEVIEKRGTVLIFNKIIDADTLQIDVFSGTRTANWSAVWKDGSTRLILQPLTGDPVAFGTEYRLVLSRVRDTAGNTVAEITVAFTTLEGDDEEVEENIETLGGDGTAGFAGDGGPATEMQVDTPSDVSVDSLGNVYVADTGNDRIRKIDASGNASTVAGDGAEGYSGDGGSATDASLDGPLGVSTDAEGNIYIADTGNNRIRRIDATTGEITTVAGDGSQGFSGDGAGATDASLDAPSSVLVDKDGNILVADRGNRRIRKIDASTGEISTVAGTGASGFSGDGGGATDAGLEDPKGIFADRSGNLYVVDGTRIRKVDAESGEISTLGGGGSRDGSDREGGQATDAKLLPEDVFVDDEGNLYIADVGRILKVDRETGAIATIAGNGELDGLLGDGGPATDASLGASAIFADADGNLYVSDARSHRIRKVNGIVDIPVPAVVDPVARSDFNGDKTVDFRDFALFAIHFSTKEGGENFDAVYDLDESGIVDFPDFVKFVVVFGQSVASARPAGR